MGIFKKTLFIAVIIFFIALLPRLFWLDRFPNGITNDELHFVLNAKSVFYQFSDMRGVWNPLSFTPIPTEASSEIPFLLISPLIGLLPLSLFAARLPYAIIGSLTVVLAYLISRHLINRKAAFVIALVSAFNPWSLYVSRTSFDAPVAIFFFLLAFYLLLNFKKWKILIAFIPLALGFYSYIGTKVIFLPYVLLLCLYLYFANSKKYFINYLALFVLSLLLTINYFRLINTGPSRLSELISPNTSPVASEVETDRRLSITNPVSRLFTNKYTVVFKNSVSKYFNNFSPRVLFISGDEAHYVSLWQHGYFYYLDAVFLFLGFLFLFVNHKSFFLFLVSCLLISPLPEAIRADRIPAYAFHSSLQYPFLLIIIGSGIYAMIVWIKNQKLKKIAGALTFGLYLISFLNYFYLYFFRYPLYQPEGFNFSSRVLSYFLNQEQKQSSLVYVLTPEPDSAFRNYLFYTNNYRSDTVSQIQKIYQSGNQNIKFQNIIFTTSLDNLIIRPSDSLISSVNSNLPADYSKADSLIIHRLSDGQALYRLYQTRACSQFSQNQNHIYSQADFNLDRLSVSAFCQKFLRPPN